MVKIGQGLLTAFTKLTENKTKLSKQKEEEKLKQFDLNKDGNISEEEVQNVLFDANGDKKISAEDLGIYTAFISYAKKAQSENTGGNPFANLDFDINKDGKTDKNEKYTANLFNNEFFSIISDENEGMNEFIGFLENSIKLLEEKINPNENTQNRVLDVVTGNVLSQTKINENGIRRDYSYTYYKGTNIPKTTKVINKNSDTEALYTYDKKGEIVEKKVTNNNTKEIRTYGDYKDGVPTSLVVTKKENGKEVTRKYDILYTFFEGTNKVKTESIINQKTGTGAFYTYDENGEIIEKKVTTKDPKETQIYGNYVDGNPTTMTSLKSENGKEVKRSYTYTYFDGTDKVKTKTVTKENSKNEVCYFYDENGKATEKRTIKKDTNGHIISMTSITKEDGKEIEREYTYTYFNNTDIVKTKTVLNKTTNKEAIYSYDKNGKLKEKTITDKTTGKIKIETYDENEKNTKRKIVDKTNKKTTYETYDNSGNMIRKTVVDEKTGKKTTQFFDENGNLIKKTITTKKGGSEIAKTYDITLDEKGNTTETLKEKTTTDKNGDIKKYTYLKYSNSGSGYPTKYSVEYQYANGVRTKSIITQKKTEDRKNDYIKSSENYVYTNGEWQLTSTLNTETIDGKEGTKRIFYFYNENGVKTKEEETFSYNSDFEAGKPISTNSHFQLSQKEVKTYHANGNVASKVTYSSNYITTTTFDENGNEINTKKEKYDNSSYENHNTNNISRNTYIEEAEKYVGYNRIDGSYSVFGTNGSGCATFATYIMYQLGFDLTSVAKRTTSGLRKQAENENRDTPIKEVFDNLKKGANITDFIKKGDLFTRVSEGLGSHTAIVKNATYDKNTGEIKITIIGYEDNSTEKGVCEREYTIKQIGNKTISYNGVTLDINDIVFCDYLS